jgi:hypothetical protein
MPDRSRRPCIAALLVLFLATAALCRALPARAAPAPFGPPFAGAPGPGTWFIGQYYGNTVWSHQNPYQSGQGLHFGIDFNAPCGTSVVAIGDGTVFAVDGPYGAAPHNLVIAHPDGLFSLYGHLLERAPLAPGQAVHAGEVVAKSGEPGARCDLDPHLHLEVRRNQMKETVNPVPLIRLDWRRATLGIRRNGTRFERDLEHPDRWMALNDQPDVVFGGPRLNDYDRSWP